MKNTFLSFIAVFFLGTISFASTLVFIPTHNFQETQRLFEQPELNIHFYNDQFIIATSKVKPKSNYITLDKNPWLVGYSYYLVYVDESVNKSQYLESIKDRAIILHSMHDVLIVKTNEKKHGQFPPAKNDGMVRVFNSTASLPTTQIIYSEKMAVDPFVETLLSLVSGSNITTTVQHLQDYGTRDAYSSQSVEAQEWIASKFEGMGLMVEEMDFHMPGGTASDNVIATHTGTTSPNEYVVVGGHFDSINRHSDEAPGADDNASGTAAVLEIARILSQYEFNRSIIFCAFSGEEYGLYGSAAYASRAKERGKNIIGYFNLDMIGYLKPGNTMLTTLIYPQSAKPLADFYTSVCSAYLPNFVVEVGTLTGGDSDHTSFNNNGYMGIFPFENINAYSPYIHTANDIIGPSYNSQEQAVVFTKASLASVAILANSIFTQFPFQKELEFSISPNPASDWVKVELVNSYGFAKLIVHNQIGLRLFNGSFTNNIWINTSDWANGVYVFSVEHKGKLHSKKVVIRHIL